MIKVFIADDHILIREGFKKILDNEIDIKVIGEADSVFKAMDFLKKNDADVLALDIGMPDKSGLEAITDFKTIKPDLKILILSIHPENRFALRALKLGAHAYLTKESAPDDLVKAIRKIVTGRQYISETLGEQLAESYTNPNEKLPHEALSEREFQVLCSIGSGNTITNIADELCLSISTINTYRNRILEKLNQKSNAGLIRYCLQHKLVE